MEITRRIKHVLLQYYKRQFVVFLLIAVCLWYMNKLSAVYTGLMMVEVHVDGARPMSTVLDRNDLSVALKVRATGFGFLKNRIFPSVRRVNIPLEELSVQRLTGEQMHNVAIPSLERAIAARISNDIDVLSISEADVLIAIDSLASKMVPVVPKVELSLEGRYMQLGPIEIEPCSVRITAPLYLLKNVSVLHTDPLLVRNPRQEVSGFFDLVPIKGVALADKRVKYKMSFEEYSEIKINKQVRVKVVDAGKEMFYVVPDSVMVTCNVTRKYYSDFKPTDVSVYVAYDLQHPEIKQSVMVQSSIPDVVVVEIEPSVVNVYRREE